MHFTMRTVFDIDQLIADGVKPSKKKSGKTLSDKERNKKPVDKLAFA